MIKRMLMMLAGVGLLFGGIFGYHAFSNMMMKKYMFSGKVPPVVVSTVQARETAWQPRLRAVGSVEALRGVDVVSEVPGLVAGVHFRSGEEVRAGKLLVRLNTDVEAAEMRSLEAACELSRIVHERDLKQFEAQAVSQAVVDAGAADLKARRAQVARQKAEIAKKFIRAPFSGKLGITPVTPGSYIAAGEKIVTLQALEAVHVNVHLPQQVLPRLREGQRVEASVDAYPGRIFSGRVSALSSRVEAASRNILVQVEVDNPRSELLPGMFASVEILAGEAGLLVTLPQTAVTYNPYGETVYVVEDKGKGSDGNPRLNVKQVFVVPGEARGDQVSILKGIKAGDIVVTSGQLKLRNGSAVVVNNEVELANDAAPEPQEE